MCDVCGMWARVRWLYRVASDKSAPSCAHLIDDDRVTKSFIVYDHTCVHIRIHTLSVKTRHNREFKHTRSCSRHTDPPSTTHTHTLFLLHTFSLSHTHTQSYQIRVGRLQPLRTQPPLLHLAWLEVLHQHVALFRQCLHDGLSLPALQVDHQGLLVAGDGVPPCTGIP